MSICRALPLVALLIVLPHAAQAQFGGMPGMPGSPGTPGSPFGAPRGPPPVCRELMAIQQDVQKHATAIKTAGEHKATPVVACKLFRSFLAADSRMIKAVAQHGAECGVPPNMPKEMKAGHANAEKIAKQVCEAAAQAGRPAAPSLSDAFGTAPVLPDATNKKRGGAFDTLTGNALAR